MDNYQLHEKIQEFSFFFIFWDLFWVQLRLNAIIFALSAILAFNEVSFWTLTYWISFQRDNLHYRKKKLYAKHFINAYEISFSSDSLLVSGGFMWKFLLIHAPIEVSRRKETNKSFYYQALSLQTRNQHLKPTSYCLQILFLILSKFKRII